MRVTVAELRALARAVALDPHLPVELGEPGAGWSMDARTRTISCDPLDLRDQHPDDVRGLVCHEAAHVAVTRYPRLLPRSEWARNPGLLALLNALEDCRIEDWLGARLPGARPWIARYNERLFPADAGGLHRRPLSHQFCLGIIHAWWHGALPEGLSPEVAAALQATEAARARAIGASPPVDVTATGAGYGGSPVARCFARHDALSPPDGFERAVRLAAWASWEAVHTGVRPAWEQLRTLDRARCPGLLREDERLLGRLRAVTEVPVGGRSPSQRMGAMGGGAPLRPAHRDALREASAAGGGGVWGDARRDVAELVERTAEAVGRALRLEAYPHWVAGASSGSRVDLGAAMQACADPRRRQAIWERKTLPRKQDPAFLVLLDLSGSMDGAGIHHGFRGVVLLCEVLERLGVPFAVDGYQDVRIPFKPFHRPLDATARERIGEMPAEVQGRRAGGRNRPEHNHDGPVLREAATELLSFPAGDRVLVVVSDGLPSGPADPERSLREAVQAVEATGAIHLVGLGLGRGTAHVARYYRSHLAEVPLEDFPAALGQLLAKRLTRGAA